MKNVFAFFAVSLFMMSSLNLNAKVYSGHVSRNVDCFDAAEAAEEAFMAYMVSFRIIPTEEQAYNVFSAAFDACYETVN